MEYRIGDGNLDSEAVRVWVCEFDVVRWGSELAGVVYNLEGMTECLGVGVGNCFLYEL